MGRRFGARSDGIGEVVFNTAMSGYQEILTDPSYAGQIIVMTYPQIGNYGITRDDAESRKLFLSALVVKERSRIASNWRAVQGLDEYLAENGIPGLEGIDTRALVRHLRSQGALRGILADLNVDDLELLSRARAHPSMAGTDLASGVARGDIYSWAEQAVTVSGTWTQQSLFTFGQSSQFHVVVYDYGTKWNILRCLVKVGCRVTVVPPEIAASDILALRPDGVVLSNGPGDPDPLQYAVRNIQSLLGRVPVAGICLGHQLLALASGGKTYKLKFGHRGSNHPVLETRTGQVRITAHNHGFSVDADSLPNRTTEITHINLNDNTVEGLRLRDLPAFSVQYHPEASPGPHDSLDFFTDFVEMIKLWRGSDTHAKAR